MLVDAPAHVGGIVTTCFIVEDSFELDMTVDERFQELFSSLSGTLNLSIAIHSQILSFESSISNNPFRSPKIAPDKILDA